MTRPALAALAALVVAAWSHAGPVGSPVGRWEHAVGGTTTEIEVFEESDGRLAARIVAVRDLDGKLMHPQCAVCVDTGQLMEGYRFVYGLSRSGDRWTGGKVVDLRPLGTGRIADCELWVERGELVLYGYAKILGFKLGQETRWTGIAR